MKKLLISILIILLLVLSYYALVKGISLLRIKSINNIKEASNNLDNKFNEANEISSKKYPLEIEGLEEAINQLKISRQEYESKKIYSTEENSLGALEIKTYKIHYLWTILGNYRKNRGVDTLTLDLRTTENKDVYDLQFTLLGNYIGITDFIYDIENDEELNFEIKNFSISSEVLGNQESVQNSEQTEEQNQTQQTQTQQQTTENISEEQKGIILQARFTVEDIGITLD